MSLALRREQPAPPSHDLLEHRHAELPPQPVPISRRQKRATLPVQQNQRVGGRYRRQTGQRLHLLQGQGRLFMPGSSEPPPRTIHPRTPAPGPSPNAGNRTTAPALRSAEPAPWDNEIRLCLAAKSAAAKGTAGMTIEHPARLGDHREFRKLREHRGPPRPPPRTELVPSRLKRAPSGSEISEDFARKSPSHAPG